MTHRFYRRLQVLFVAVFITALVSCGGSSSGGSGSSQGDTDNIGDVSGDTGGDVGGDTGNESTDATTDPETDSENDQDAGNETGSDTDSETDAGLDTDSDADSDSDNETAGVTQPNILLVITDDQGLDSSAQYSLSNDLPNTPVIDGLARDGIVYDNAWATPTCTTTRATLLSGKYGTNTGVITNGGTLSADVGTIQAFLKTSDVTSNYQTAVFGKWQVGGRNPDPMHPNELGVDHYAGHLDGTLNDYFDWQVTTNGVETRETTYHTTALVNYAIDWIAEQDSPWFTWMAFAAPHVPLHAPPEGFNTRNLSGTNADINANGREYYLAAIETLDAELGRLLDSMDAETRENTIIMVIGDNGTPRNLVDPTVYPTTRHGKGGLFDSGVNVPLVISGAGVERSGVRDSGLVTVTDFFPTIAALAGSDNTGATDGRNFAQSFTADNAITRQFIYTEYTTNDFPLGSGWTVRSEAYKFLDYDDGSEALYDLVADPQESNNLLLSGGDFADIIEPLRSYGLQERGEAAGF